MKTLTKQARRKCRDCQRPTLHVAEVRRHDVGPWWAFQHAMLCVLTLGAWLPVAICLSLFKNLSNLLSRPKYLCQTCGRAN